MRKLYEFNGGIHPAEHKRESTTRPIGRAPIPARLAVPLSQHIGHAARAMVEAGDRVLKGQMIGKPDGTISAAVHAPTSGTVVAVKLHPVPHPSGMSDLCVIIDSDGEDRWIALEPVDPAHLDANELRQRLCDAGVVGLGGAVFPSHAKLNPGRQQKVPTLIINGAECEPWITCDDMLMRERAAGVVEGIKIMRRMLDSDEVLIGIEDNKPEAIAAMRAACDGTGFEVVEVPTRYPSGGAKQLTKLLTGKEPPSGGRSTDIGVQVFNVGTAYSIHRAIQFGEPVISRMVTITGNVRRPQNFEVLIGTPVSELISLTGMPYEDTLGYIMGGPMMGFDLPSEQAPVVKAMNCIIAKSRAMFPTAPKAMPCIRCTQCAQACPADLQPQELYWFAKSKNFGKAQEYNLFDCIECGCCNYVCPSHIPLVEYYRFAKSEIWAREKEKNAADIARERHEFRQFRQEREKEERAAKMAQKAAASKATAATPTPDADAKKAAIQAAIERSKAKKAGIVPQNIDNLPADKLKEIQEIEARRAKLKQAMENEQTDSEQS